MGIRLLFTCLLLFFVTVLFARAARDTVKENLDKIFIKVEVQPSFIGGDDALGKYLIETVNLTKPKTKEKREECILSFLQREYLRR